MASVGENIAATALSDLISRPFEERRRAAFRIRPHLEHGLRWRGRLLVPQHAHRFVKRLIEILNDQKTTIKECSGRAGISESLISNWCSRRQPKLADFEAALNAMGYELRIVRTKDDAA